MRVQKRNIEKGQRLKQCRAAQRSERSVIKYTVMPVYKRIISLQKYPQLFGVNR